MSGSSSTSDSAFGSASDGTTNQAQPVLIRTSITSTQISKNINPMRQNIRELPINSDDLIDTARQMRRKNELISSSIRTVLSCFQDLNIGKFEPRTDFMVNFISNGANKCVFSLLRPVSTIWPDTYEKMIEQLAILDAYLLETEFREKPVQWMRDRGLLTVPGCKQCSKKMELRFEETSVRWQCRQTQPCMSYFMPIQRASFFNQCENIALDKLLFSFYYWSICTPAEELYDELKIEPVVLHEIWRRLQNICRTALEKCYPRHRLTNLLDDEEPKDKPPLPIDLVTVRLNEVFIVCAKHPKSNLVRLGIHIPRVSEYSLVELTESWFAHGAHIRVSESKFLSLSEVRTDLKVDLVSRTDMVTRDGRFSFESAFGYIVCQLTHILKDFDSSTLSCESLKLVLAEMQWRELYGTTPYDAFTNMANHIAQYGDSATWYKEPNLPIRAPPKPSGDQTPVTNPDYDGSEFVWVERYFYASCDPIDQNGKVICRFAEPVNLERPPNPDVRVRCHECDLMFECFEFSIHMMAHVENNRREYERREYVKKRLVECKHCFKTIKREKIAAHSAIFRSHLQTIKHGCRICCILFKHRSKFLQHMRTKHFECETPYRCPKCPFASSFQRDVFIHFQEEHRHSMIILCPFCLRSFSVIEPENMTLEMMSEISKNVYNHIAEHYVVSKGYSCGNCCLCFLDNDALNSHRAKHHNPLEVRDKTKVKVQPFVITAQETKVCVKALTSELFVSNQKPNATLNLNDKPEKVTETQPSVKKGRPPKKCPQTNNKLDDGPKDTTAKDKQLYITAAEAVLAGQNKQAARRSKKASNSVCSSDDEEVYHGSRSPSTSVSVMHQSDSEEDDAGIEGDTIHVRGKARRILDGGNPSLFVGRGKAPKTTKTSEPLTSSQLLTYLSRMKRADGVIPNQSVLLTPSDLPAKCCECLQYITVDHYVALLKCKTCKLYQTYCPRAFMLHKDSYHPKSAVE